MYYFAILDDNKEDQTKVYRFLCDECKKYNLDYTCDIFSKSMEFDMNKEYDAIFLDIDLDKDNGIKFAKDYKIEHETKIIFISNHSNFMHNTFDVQPFHFIYKENLVFEGIHVFHLLLDALLNDDKFLTVTIKANKKNIRLKEIFYIQANDHMIYIHVKQDKKEFQIWDSLSRLIQELSTHGFVQINKSTIINMQYIQSIISKQVILKNKSTLKIGAAYYNNLLNAYKKYLLTKI